MLESQIKEFQHRRINQPQSNSEHGLAMQTSIYIRCLFSFLLITSFECLSVCSQETTTEKNLHSQLGLPLGTPVTVTGVLIESLSKGEGTTLLVQKINGKQTQRQIQIRVNFLISSGYLNRDVYLEHGRTFECSGFETGKYVGIPFAIQAQVFKGFPEPDFQFKNELWIAKASPAEIIRWNPAELVGKVSILSGISKNNLQKPVISGIDWDIELVGKSEWEDAELGKQWEVLGIVSDTDIPGFYKVTPQYLNLSNLEEQLGKSVALRGIAMRRNNKWWFRYKGMEIDIPAMQSISDWKEDFHRTPILVNGTLSKESVPMKESLGRNEEAAHEHYVIREATWSRIDYLLSPEFFQANKH